MWQQAWQALRDRVIPAKIGRGQVVEIFSKADCSLCETAKAELLRLQQKWGFELREVNLAHDEVLLRKYGARIPLVRVNGKLVCKYKIDVEALRHKLIGVRTAGEE